MSRYEVYKGDVEIVCDLDLKKYLGKWYEIARLPIRAEKNMDNITAEYSLKRNGKIQVLNAGYRRGKKKDIKAKAWIPDRRCKGALEVSFFWPFKSEYNVIRIDKDYKYAVVMGDTKQNMWILSRTPHMEIEDYRELIDFLDEKGFDTHKIINARQDRR